jgi:hypothetical protein
MATAFATAVVLSVAVVLVCSQGVLADPSPLWHKRFVLEFNETTPPALNYRTDGKWWYDSTQSAELIHRTSGAGDRYCSTIYPLTRTSCQHLVVEGKRYLVFPEKKYCCMCCDAAHGCGIVSPTWLQDAKFEGTVNISGVSAYKWSKNGLQPNYYYSSADARQVPIELDQIPTDYQAFHASTFDEGVIDPSVFTVPDYCHASCPWYSICTAIGGRSNFAAGASQLRQRIGRLLE